MSIQRIKIKNYKSINEINLDLREKNILTLIGINNVGKTNVLEALNTIKNANSNKFYNNSRQSDMLNFHTKHENFNNKKLPEKFYFEIKYLYNFKGQNKIFTINSKKKNNNVLLEQMVTHVINSYENVLEKHFKNKYILRKNFDDFKNNLKLFLENPKGIYNLLLNYYSPFNDIDDAILDDKNRLEKWFHEYLSKRYVFSENEIKEAIKDLTKFIDDFNELKKILINYDFSTKIFYISTTLETYENYEIFNPIDLSKEITDIFVKDNYLSSLIYINNDYKNILEKIKEMLNSQEKNKMEEVVDQINEKLKKEFLRNILTDNNINDQSYTIYPKFIMKENGLISSLALIKNIGKLSESEESIALISEGLRNKLILKLNLDYCKKNHDKEIILLIDEPDRGLHINAVLELYNELKEITDTTKTKIIYTTHSPYLLGNIFENHSNILIVEKDKNNKTVINKESINITELSNTIIDKMSVITGNEYLIINALNSINYQYVTVEGKTDYHFYTWYNKKHHKNQKLFFVSLNGKENQKIIEIFKKLNLKYISLYDNDCEDKNDILDQKNIKLDSKRIMTYQHVLKGTHIKNLEDLLNNKKHNHLNYLKKDSIMLNNYYEELLNNQTVKENVEILFWNIYKKFGDLND